MVSIYKYKNPYIIQTAVQTKLGLHEDSSRGGSGGTGSGMNNEMED